MGSSAAGPQRGERKRAKLCEKPPPNLLFAERLRPLMRGKKFDAALSSLSMTNVVLLTALGSSPTARWRRGIRTRAIFPPAIKTCTGVGQWSHEMMKTPTSHYRIGTRQAGTTESDGKFLIFATNNIIRAGKYTHAHAVASTLKMVRFLKQQGALHPACYPVAISSPNSVVTGKCNIDIDPEKLKAHWQAHSTPRFPGIAINLNVEGVVPEVYPSDNRFILPGVRRPEQLADATRELLTILESCTAEP